MISDAEALIQNSGLEKSNSEKYIFEFNGNKVPLKSLRVLRDDFIRENEWQQEYYIIYNSYVLDEKETELTS